jgi:hypothetical protein
MVHSERYPRTMPMTAAIAPEFSRRHPRAAVIFDNLHMKHDIISDVLALLPFRKIGSGRRSSSSSRSSAVRQET